ncbi:PAS domain-containing protein [uncultured Flavobacterium sp.]|uniref:PAS domain-containing protein n=1 Tax=uncultured Flavobacterium sp. TaxID=165435 RepID=UPI0025E35FD3|nr:PAS domain-containing protein [uncultured Flavobacterium sp.]
MTDLDDYDNAFARYSKTMENKTMPLYSWDLFSTYFDKLKTSVLDSGKLKLLSKNNKWIENWDFNAELQKENVIVVTDTDLNIVFASQNIIEMTGYSSEEILGKNPKIFQGKNTSLLERKAIREAISLQKPFNKTIVNYKKNGEAYVCQIKGFPVFNMKNELVNFVAFEKAA